MTVGLLQSSCGMAVPYFNFAGDRELLKDWAVKQGDEGLQEYWRMKNQISLDGIRTQIVAKNI